MRSAGPATNRPLLIPSALRSGGTLAEQAARRASWCGARRGDWARLVEAWASLRRALGVREYDRAVSPLRGAHSIAEFGEVIIGVDDEAFQRAPACFIKAAVIERDPAAAEGLIAADFFPGHALLSDSEIGFFGASKVWHRALRGGCSGASALAVQCVVCLRA